MRVRSLTAIAAAVAVGVFGAWLALRAFGADSVALGPFTAEIRTAPGEGETIVALPPLGEVEVDTHDVPLRISARLTDVDVERLASDLKDRTTAEIAADVEADARSVVAPFAARTLAVAVAGGFLAGAIVYRRRWRPVVTAGAAALVVFGASVGVTSATYRTQAFAEPRFVGTLRLAPQLLGPVRGLTQRLDEFRTNLERIVGGAIRAYSALEPQTIGGGDEIRVLHISDVHLNTLGMDFAVQLARGFDVDLVVDTGDLTSYGTPVEEAIVSEIPRFGRPYVFVRGNHDPGSVADAVEATENGRVLDGRVRKLGGLRIYGVPHPVFTEDQQDDVDSETLAAGAEAAAADLARDVEALDEAPDVVAVHDDRMAAGLAGEVGVVLSGHFHRARASVMDGTLYVRAGSTGGAGVNMFRRQEPVPLSATVLYFERGRETGGREPIAYDVIEQSPTTGRLTIQRHLVADAPPSSPAPDPPSSPGP